MSFLVFSDLVLQDLAQSDGAKHTTYRSPPLASNTRSVQLLYLQHVIARLDKRYFYRSIRLHGSQQCGQILLSAQAPGMPTAAIGNDRVDFVPPPLGR
jgi:hypothetical protein